MPLPRLYISHEADRDRLFALEFGRPSDGQPSENWRSVGDSFGFLRDGPEGRIIGFGVSGFSSFDVDDPDVSEIWTAAEFDAPLVGLARASAAEIILAARPLLGDRSTVNRRFFDLAVELQDEDPDEGLDLWLSCLESGEPMAHFAVGYMLYDRERYHEAYRHLRYYAEIAPAEPWNWCWLGKAAQKIGEPEEAHSSCLRAVELSDDPDDTDALELLRELHGDTKPHTA